MKETPDESVLESMHQMVSRDSEQLNTIFALCNQGTMQKNEFASHIRLKNVVQKYLDQKTKHRHFDARNVWARATIRRKGDDISTSENKNKGMVTSGWLKVKSPKETHAVSKYELSKKDKVKCKRDRPRSPSPGPPITKKWQPRLKRLINKKNPQRHQLIRKREAIFMLLERKVRETVLWILAPPECVKHKTNEGCKFDETRAFLHSENRCKTKKDNKRFESRQSNNRYCTQYSQVALCISGYWSLPEPNGWTYERETVHPEEKRQTISKDPPQPKIRNIRRTSRHNSGTIWTMSGSHPRWCSTSFREQRSKFYIVGRRWCKESSLTKNQTVVQSSRNILGERSHILSTNNGMESIIYLDRHPTRKRIQCGFWCLYARD